MAGALRTRPVNWVPGLHALASGSRSRGASVDDGGGSDQAHHGGQRSCDRAPSTAVAYQDGLKMLGRRQWRRGGLLYQAADLFVVHVYTKSPEPGSFTSDLKILRLLNVGLDDDLSEVITTCVRPGIGPAARQGGPLARRRAPAKRPAPDCHLRWSPSLPSEGVSRRLPEVVPPRRRRRPRGLAGTPASPTSIHERGLVGLPQFFPTQRPGPGRHRITSATQRAGWPSGFGGRCRSGRRCGSDRGPPR